MWRIGVKMLLKGKKLFLGKSWPHRFSAQRRKLRTCGLCLCIYFYPDHKQVLSHLCFLRSLLYLYQVRGDNGCKPCVLTTSAANIRKMLWKWQMGRAINAIANGFMCSLSLLPTYFYQYFPKNFPGLHLKYDPMAPKHMCFLSQLSVSKMYLHFKFKCLSTRVLNHGKCYCLGITVIYFYLDYCYKFCGAFYGFFPPIS